MKLFTIALMGLVVTTLASTAQAVISVQGFESGTGDWAGTINRVSSPLSPAGGSYYAIAKQDAYTYFDQTPSTVWTGPYTQSIDVYIDTAAGIVGDKWNLDFGIRRASDGTWLDDTGLGAGKASDGWYVDYTGNGGSYNVPLGSGTKIDTSGWYTIGVVWTAGSSFLNRHVFVEPLNGAEIYSYDNTKTYQGLALDPAHQPGGPDYAWFSQLTMSDGLAVDNATLITSSVPEPASVIVWSLLGLTIGGAGWWRRHKRAA